MVFHNKMKRSQLCNIKTNTVEGEILAKLIDTEDSKDRETAMQQIFESVKKEEIDGDALLNEAISSMSSILSNASKLLVHQ